MFFQHSPATLDHGRKSEKTRAHARPAELPVRDGLQQLCRTPSRRSATARTGTLVLLTTRVRYSGSGVAATDPRCRRRHVGGDRIPLDKVLGRTGEQEWSSRGRRVNEFPTAPVFLGSRKARQSQLERQL